MHAQKVSSDYITLQKTSGERYPWGSQHAITAAISKLPNENAGKIQALFSVSSQQQITKMGQKLRGRFVSSDLLLSSTDSQKEKKKRKLLNYFFVFRKCNLEVSRESLPSICTYRQHLMKHLISLMWPDKHDSENGNLGYLQIGIMNPLKNS